ncbi:MAG: NAD(P)-dependent oxidoreductase [Planctomycetaceae bacterium]|nr:NAD(P)-dependent oxidoreductase [Planctomycetaceae bacterium]
MYQVRLPHDPIPLPLLVTGVAGPSGYHALHYFQSRYPGQVVGIRQEDTWQLEGPGIVACNTEDAEALARLFAEHRFRTVLNCAGSCALKSCQLDPVLAQRANVEGVGHVARLAREYGARLVHLSIDLVYSGDKGGDYVETDPTDPVTVYGRTMVEGEQVVLETDPDACILRISLPMAVSFNGHAGAVDWIASRFRKSRPATLYYDEIRTPTYGDCLSRLCEIMLARSFSGIYHAGGPRKLSLYQIAQVINRVGGYDPKLLFGLSRLHAGPIPPRAGDVTMDSSKLIEALGYNPFTAWPLDDRFAPTHRTWHHERPADEPRGPEILHEFLCVNPAAEVGPVIPCEPGRHYGVRV